jgi:hypothetical protein
MADFAPLSLVVIPAKAGLQGCKSSLVALDPSHDNSHALPLLSPERVYSAFS